MRVDVSFAGTSAIAADIEGVIARAATEAMRETSPIAAAELREQVVAAGLGGRLANTWRWRTYPDQGRARASLSPAGYIWSRAPDIIDAFSRGAQIVPLNGKRFLAIPTDNVPRAGNRRGATKRMTPEQVEIAFNQDLFFKRGQRGRVLAFVNALAARSGRGHRRGTSRRLAQGRALKPILMFVLVPTVRLPKVLDIAGVAERWAARYDAAMNRRLAAA